MTQHITCKNSGKETTPGTTDEQGRVFCPLCSGRIKLTKSGTYRKHRNMLMEATSNAPAPKLPELSRLMDGLNTGTIARCTTSGDHCEQCGETSPEYVSRFHNDGYSMCCNELIVDASSCRNFHNER